MEQMIKQEKKGRIAPFFKEGLPVYMILPHCSGFPSEVSSLDKLKNSTVTRLLNDENYPKPYTIL